MFGINKDRFMLMVGLVVTATIAGPCTVKAVDIVRKELSNPSTEPNAWYMRCPSDGTVAVESDLVDQPLGVTGSGVICDFSR